jgi:hypothetical protein
LTFGLQTMSLTRAPSPDVLMSADTEFLYASLREKVLEHLFVGELLWCLWRSGRTDIELLRAEVDFRGYNSNRAIVGREQNLSMRTSLWREGKKRLHHLDQIRSIHGGAWPVLMVRRRTGACHSAIRR